MPVQRKIPRQKRVEIFLRWRFKKRKVYPVAKELGLARPTVAAIVKEFLDDGFSDAPRAHLPSHILERLQGAHLKEMSSALKGMALPPLHPPEQHTRKTDDSSFDGGHGSNEVNRPTGSALNGHLRGTGVEEPLFQALDAVNDYYMQCEGLWNDIASILKDRTHLRLTPFQKPTQGHSPHGVYEKLVDMVYSRFFRILDWPITRGDSWPYWSTEEGDLATLKASHNVVARGSVEEHGAVINAVVEFFNEDNLHIYKGRAAQLRLLHYDLKYMVDLIHEEISKVDVETLRKGICPRCPYPEAILNSSGNVAG